MNTIRSITLRSTAVVLVSISTLVAGTGGKLAGGITDTSGNPLIGVNIVIENTGLGTASDTDGDYFILNIPPGRYTVRFMMMGYKTSVREDVVIRSDFTAQLDVRMEETVLEAGEEVIITASRPLIQRDATSSVKIVDAQDIVDMPVVDFKDVLVTQAGFTEDASGGIHVRGGRTKEILYMIDGVVVKDPLVGDFSGSVNQNAIQEMTIISGTFNAEYGQAMSSVVNIVTKEGGNKFHGKFEHITDQLNVLPYHKSGAFADVSDTGYVWQSLKGKLFDYVEPTIDRAASKPLLPMLNLPVEGSANLNLGGKLPLLNGHYFMSGYYRSVDSHLPHGANIDQDIQLKLTTNLTPKIKLAGHLHSSNRLYQRYSHKWKYRPDYQAHTFKSNDRLALTLTHSISAPMFYTLYLTKQDVSTKTGVMDKAPADYERPLTDETVYFYATGNEGIFVDNHSESYSAKFDLTYQANSRHLLKVGFTFSPHTLDIHTEEQPWVGGTNFKDDTTFTPTEASFYIQDKIEYDFLILNLGLRFDRVAPEAAMWEDINRFVEWDSTNNVWMPAEQTEVEAQSQFSPRVGIAYPVTDKTVFHFSYGHFFQTPTFDAFTYNAARDVSSSLPLVGNPRVKAQKTVAFETGIKQVISTDVSTELTVWSKDIRDLLSTLQIRYLSNQYVVYSNTDYASVKGLDLAINKRFAGYFGGSINYSMGVARATTPILSGDTFPPMSRKRFRIRSTF